MHRTPPLTFDPAAVQAWLLQPSDEFEDTSRAESLGVDTELTAPGADGFLNTVDDVLAASPDGLHHRTDITAVQMWRLPDGDVLDQGALITVDLANGVRLATVRQDIKDFTDRDQHGIPAVLSALAHIANQASALLDTYAGAHPDTPTAADATAATINDVSRADHQARLDAEVQRLTADIAELTAERDAAEHVGLNRRVDVEELGRRVIHLLDDLRTHRAAGSRPGGELSRVLQGLREAVNVSAESEQDTRTSVDIFAVGIALAQHSLAAMADATARITVGELAERLRAFPEHLEVWITDPRSLDGFAPLDGTVHRGSDPAPAAGDPTSFVVLGAAR